MDKRSTSHVLEEWRIHWLSGQTHCRTSTGAACRGGVALRVTKTRLGLLVAFSHQGDVKFVPIF
jgi:hypothetical protein